jgi:hypothetical protein
MSDGREDSFGSTSLDPALLTVDGGPFVELHLHKVRFRPKPADRHHPVRTYTLDVADSKWIELVEYWTYRLGGFVILNVLDDPAWLALIFC